MNNIKPAKYQTDLLKQDTYTECELKWNCLELFPLNKVESVFKNIVSDKCISKKLEKLIHVYFSPYIELYVLYLGKNNITVCLELPPNLIEIRPVDKISFAKE